MLRCARRRLAPLFKHRSWCIGSLGHDAVIPPMLSRMPCPKGGNAAGRLAFSRRRARARGSMHVSTRHQEILERIGHTLVDANEELATEALPQPMLVLLDQSPTHQADETNILC